MKKKTFAIAASILALSALLNTAAFAVTEHRWFARPAETVTVLTRDASRPA